MFLFHSYFRHTTSQELYPLNAVEQPTTAGLGSSLKKHSDSGRFEQLLAAEQAEEEALRDGLLEKEERAMDNDAMMWSTERVRKWLVQVGLEDLYGELYIFFLLYVCHIFTSSFLFIGV